ncbi:MAG: hypothetical protein WC796_00295 [Candidatus Pacearchaeota archaeon]|jgi:hypothetical protein
MNKRGQVTIFIIIAIVIIAAVIIFFAIKNYNVLPDQENLDKIPEAQNIKLFVESCLKTTSETSITSIGQKGGYFNLTSNKINIFLYEYPVFIQNDNSYVPTLESIQTEISHSIEYNIKDCLDDFQQFTDQGISVSFKDIQATTKINENYTEVTLNMPLTIKKGSSTAKISVFSTRVEPLKLPSILNSVNQLINKQVKSKNTLCFSCVSDSIKEKNMKLKVLDSNNVFLYTLTDYDSNFTSSPYEFKFIGTYDFPECNSTGGCFNELNK